MTSNKLYRKGTLKKKPKFIPDALYAQILDSIPIATTDFVITRKGEDGVKQFMLGKRLEPPWVNNYAVPGGRINKGETLMGACLRHLRREFGISDSQIDEWPKLITCMSVRNPSSKYGGAWYSIWHVYEVSVPWDTKVIPNRENTSVRWFTTINRRWPEPVRRALHKMGFRDNVKK